MEGRQKLPSPHRRAHPALVTCTRAGTPAGEATYDSHSQLGPLHLQAAAPKSGRRRLRLSGGQAARARGPSNASTHRAAFGSIAPAQRETARVNTAVWSLSATEAKTTTVVSATRRGKSTRSAGPTPVRSAIGRQRQWTRASRATPMTLIVSGATECLRPCYTRVNSARGDRSAGGPTAGPDARSPPTHAQHPPHIAALRSQTPLVAAPLTTAAIETAAATPAAAPRPRQWRQRHTTSAHPTPSARPLGPQPPRRRRPSPLSARPP